MSESQAQPQTATATPVQERKPEAAPASSGARVQHSTGQAGVPARLQSTEVIQFESAAAGGAAELIQFAGDNTAAVHQAAAQGISGASAQLPHLDAIQNSFGNHDVSGVEAHTDSAASQANEAMGSMGFATGNHVAFGGGSPDLHTAAHEAAHVVQQRAGVSLKGGVGSAGDAHEQHADAVADRVVQGQSASDLLDKVAPSGGGGGVQQKAVQFDIKADLREAVSGWGTDEQAIFNRLGRATPDELQAVLDDTALMGELRDDLDQGDMSRALDLLRAPLQMKLRLAMGGWGTDEQYIHRSLLNASELELQAVAEDTALVDELESELSGDDIRSVLNRLNVPLARKLQYAVAGWGTDEQFIFDSIAAAPMGQVQALAGDDAAIANIDDDLSGEELDHFRGLLARRIWLETNDGPLAFRMINGSDGQRTARLAWVGDITVQRTLLDAEIMNDTDSGRVINAFQTYWAVEIGVQDGATMNQWPIDVLRNIHAQLKLLPDQDSRGGFWRRLTLSDASLIDSTTGGEVGLKTRAAYNDAAGNFIVGTQASATSTIPMGYNTQLTAGAAIDDLKIKVQEPGRLAANDLIAISSGAAREGNLKIQSIAGDYWNLDRKLTKPHSFGAYVAPDDGTATGNNTTLKTATAVNDTSVSIWNPSIVAVNDQVAVGFGANMERGLKVQTIGASSFTFDRKLANVHGVGENVSPDDGSTVRAVNWLAATVRHEIAHGVDANVGVQPYKDLGGWWVADSEGGDFNTWANAMGTPWAVSTGAPLTQVEKDQIRDAIVDATSNRKGSLYGATLNLPATHPIKARQTANIPVVRAAEACLSQGDGHTNRPTSFYRNGGKAFTINYWYKKFMYFNDTIIDQRVSNYSLYAPTEFFAEAYTTFYEEAGRTGVNPADYGRLIRNTTWRDWIRTHIHDRGHAPAGTGAATTGPGAAPGQASVGRAAGDPG